MPAVRITHQQVIALDDRQAKHRFDYENLLQATGDRTIEIEAF